MAKLVSLFAASILISTLVFAQATTQVASSLNRIEQVNKEGQKLGQIRETDPTKVCAECDVVNGTDILYSDCAAYGRNNYMDPLIAASSSSLVKNLSAAPLKSNYIKAACTKHAMENQIISDGSFSTSCIGAGKVKPARACTTGPYHRLMHNSFELAADCMKDFLNVPNYEDVVEELMALLTIESNFQLNAVSPTGAGGVGQLTGRGGAIEDVNNKALRDLQRYFASHSNEACRGLTSVVKKPMSYARCERMSLNSDNPIKNLIFSFAYRKISHGYLKHGLESKVLRSKFATEELYNKFVQSAISHSHNTGAGGYSSKAKTALNFMPAGSIKTESDLQIAYTAVFRSFSGQSDPQACHTNASISRKENACYYIKIQDKFSKVRKAVLGDGGLSCANKSSSI